jgi:hypothetical protein
MCSSRFAALNAAAAKPMAAKTKPSPKTRYYKNSYLNLDILIQMFYIKIIQELKKSYKKK